MSTSTLTTVPVDAAAHARDELARLARRVDIEATLHRGLEALPDVRHRSGRSRPLLVGAVLALLAVLAVAVIGRRRHQREDVPEPTDEPAG